LKTELESPSGEKISFEDILFNDSFKLIYLDFWATWCAPCIMEMPYSQKLVDELKSDSIMFAYISIDKDRNKWGKKVSTLPQGKNVRQFYLGHNENLIQEMEILSVPRYFLVNTHGQMISNNAPRPQSKEIRELFYKNIRKQLTDKK
jgi:thiol-disulfide isomerase/thioredoxin